MLASDPLGESIGKTSSLSLPLSTPPSTELSMLLPEAAVDFIVGGGGAGYFGGFLIVALLSNRGRDGRFGESVFSLYAFFQQS